MRRVFNKIYGVVKRIPSGKVLTYGRVARQVGTSPRVVGKALHQNPDLENIPCHRVVGADGHLVGYVNGLEKKRKLLLAEGVRFKDRNHVNLNKGKD